MGQVFTPKSVARVMIRYLLEDLNKGSILDPCYGGNIFFNTMEELVSETKFVNYKKVGLEVDPKFLRKNEPQKKLEFIQKNFFDYHPHELFDGIIMNPPYVRQEELNGKINSKKRILKALSAGYKKFLRKSYNLYIFFFIKAHQVLKTNGKLIAICYDSWLNTNYGKTFMKFLEENFSIKKILHFEEKVFTNVNIGAMILYLIKTKNKKPKKTIYVKYRSANDIEGFHDPIIKAKINKLENLKNIDLKQKIPIDYSSEIFLDITKVCDQPIRRGIESRFNGLILDHQKYEDMVPIIKDIKTIDYYEVKKDDLHYLINIKENIKLTNLSHYIDQLEQKSSDLKKYIKQLEREILVNKGYSALKKCIKNKKPWYRIRIVPPGNFLFNYYLRKNLRFIYNPNHYFISHNFYIIQINKKPLLNLAILNSIVTKLNIVLNARTQGSGLRKIQLYEFKKIRIINPSFISPNNIRNLEKLGKELTNCKAIGINTKTQEVLRKIDEILVEEINKFCSIKINRKKLYEIYKSIWTN